MAAVGNVREVKLVLLGEAGVGKSSLVLRFVANHFKAYSESTIGCVRHLSLRFHVRIETRPPGAPNGRRSPGWG